MANEIKLGGGVAQAVALRGVNTTENMAGNNELSSIVSGLNSMVQNLGQSQARKELIRNEEDKVRAVNKAEIEHYDVTNALSEASYDQNLNNEVSQWRANGLMDSEIRTKIKDYKFNKMVQDSGLGQDGGRSADSADMAFFDTFTKLEMKAVVPMIQEDRKVVQSRINNMTASYVMNSDEPLQDKYNNVVTTNKSYGMGEEEATLHIINTAFNKARRGDDSLLKELQGVTTSTGEKLIDTVKGADIYNKLTDNLMAKKEHDLAVSRKETEFNQEVEATKLYTNLIDTKDIHSFKLGIDNALQSGSISMKQHSSLNAYYKTVSNIDGFAKNDDMSIYAQLFAKAEQGTLKPEEAIRFQGKLTKTSLESILRRGIQQGGLDGVGNEQSKTLDIAIKNDSEAFSGSNFATNIMAQIEDVKFADKKKSYIQFNLSSEKDAFVFANKRLPTQEEYIKMRDGVVSRAEKEFTLTPPTPPKPKEKKPVTTKASKINGKGDMINYAKTLKTKEEVDAYFESLSPSELKLLKGQ